MKKPLPRLKNEDAEREFWATHDSTDYLDWRRAKRATLANLKPSSQTISLRFRKLFGDGRGRLPRAEELLRVPRSKLRAAGLS